MWSRALHTVNSELHTRQIVPSADFTRLLIITVDFIVRKQSRYVHFALGTHTLEDTTVGSCQKLKIGVLQGHLVPPLPATSHQPQSLHYRLHETRLF